MSNVVTGLVFSLALALGATASSSQELPEYQLYKAVVERVLSAKAAEKVFAVRLQFLRSEAGDAQIAFDKPDETHFRVDIWRCVPDIFVQLSQQRDAIVGKTAEEAAALVKCQHASARLEISSSLGQLIDNGRSQSVTLPPFEDVIFLHGMEYRIDVRNASKILSMTFEGAEDASQSREPIVRWMGSVRAAVEKALF